MTTNPSDYDCADGQLAAAVGLVNEDGAMRNVWQPAVIGADLTGRKILYCHFTSRYRHYILLDERNVYALYPYLAWIDEEYIIGDHTSAEVDANTHSIVSNPGEVLSISSVGNTLVVMTPNGVLYILWKDNNYVFLGQKIPELQMQFDVTGTHAANYPGPFASGRGNGRGYAAYTKENSAVAVEAMINETHRIISDANHFYAPFNIRYCYRLFDGSMVMHSAPVFMPIVVPYTLFIEYANRFMYNGAFVAAPYTEIGESNEVDIVGPDEGEIRYQPNNVSLKYKATQPGLGNWADIVKSVDVFITPPIFRETSLNGNMNFRGDTLKYHYAYHGVTDPDGYTSLDVRQNKLRVDTISVDYSQRLLVFDYPMLTEAEYLEKIKNSSTFYKIASFDLEKGELVFGSWADLPIKTGVLSTLTAQEVMVDDYRTHNVLLPHYNNTVTNASLSAYNNRVNVSGVDDKFFEGFDIRTMVPYDKRVDAGPGSSGHGFIMAIKEVRVVLDTADGEKTVAKVYDANSMPPVWKTTLINSPLFYPDNRAKKMQIRAQNTHSSYLWYEFPMQECPMMNGAMTHGGIYADISYAGNPLPTSMSPEPGTILPGSDIENTQNKIYTSEVDNPYYFPALNINTLGAGELLATLAITKPISQGQFGQFPLYAFTTEGVWALEVAADGTFSAMHPVSRDVCTNVRSLTQTDNAILFVTDRGIMLLQGGDTLCISDGILGEGAFNVATLPHITDSNIRPSIKNKDLTMSHAFLSGCRMIYDYEHQHIIIFNPETRIEYHGLIPRPEIVIVYPYAFVYSMKSKMWGMMENSLAESINSYPDAMGLNRDGRLVSFGETSQTSVEGLIVTRPLKLDTPDLYKTVHTMVQRGVFEKGHVKTLLYGSRDLHKWYLIGSSVDEWLRGLRGTPMQWLRIAVLTDMEKGESVSGATVDFEIKEKGKMH